jgi:pyruvate dehydrogenase E1 component beta subunit
VHEACRTGGFGGEIAAVIADQGFASLKAPIKRVTGPDTPVPFSPALEGEFIVNADQSKAAVRRCCEND